MVRFLESQGFTVVRVRGSHHVLARRSTHTTVPVHANQTLRIGTLRGILRDIEMSPATFAELWHREDPVLWEGGLQSARGFTPADDWELSLSPFEKHSVSAVRIAYGEDKSERCLLSGQARGLQPNSARLWIDSPMSFERPAIVNGTDLTDTPRSCGAHQ